MGERLLYNTDRKNKMTTPVSDWLRHFLKTYVNARSEKSMCYKTSVLRTLLDLCKTCVNERTLNMRYSIYTFTMR